MVLTIILWFCIAVNLGCAWYNLRAAKRYKKQYKENMEINLSLLKEKEADTELKKSIDARYMAVRMSKWYFPAPESWCVVKIVQDNYCVIKAFTDEDDEFNQREAQELCDILNAK